MSGPREANSGTADQALLIGLTAVLACLLATLVQQLIRRRQLAARWAAEAAADEARAAADKAAESINQEASSSAADNQAETSKRPPLFNSQSVPFAHLPGSLKRAEQAKIFHTLSPEELRLERDAVLSQLRQICGILAEREGSGDEVGDTGSGLSEASMDEVRSQMQLYAQPAAL